MTACRWARCAFASALAVASRGIAQVDWSGNNTPAHDSVVQIGAPVDFRYQVYDAGRTEADGRGAGLGARLFYRDAAAPSSAYQPADMTYAGQAGIGDHDDVFAATLPPEAAPASGMLEYYTVVYDSTVAPVLEERTRQDLAGHAPPFVIRFGEATVDHNVYVHFAVCTNGLAAGPLAVQVDAGPAFPVLSWGLARVAPAQIPDLWEGDVFLPAGVNQILRYTYLTNGEPERDTGGAVVEHRLSMTPGSFLQAVSPEDSWGGGPLGCHLGETLGSELRVHLSVCLAGMPYSGATCISGDAPELGGFTVGIPLAELVPGSDLFEGDVTFPAGRRAVVRFKFQRNDCGEWENLFGGVHEATNRVLWLGGATSPYVTPTFVWANTGPNFCPPPTATSPVTWAAVKSRYR